MKKIIGNVVLATVLLAVSSFDSNAQEQRKGNEQTPNFQKIEFREFKKDSIFQFKRNSQQFKKEWSKQTPEHAQKNRYAQRSFQQRGKSRAGFQKQAPVNYAMAYKAVAAQFQKQRYADLLAMAKADGKISPKERTILKYEEDRIGNQLFRSHDNTKGKSSKSAKKK